MEHRFYHRPFVLLAALALLPACGRHCHDCSVEASYCAPAQGPAVAQQPKMEESKPAVKPNEIKSVVAKQTEIKPTVAPVETKPAAIPAEKPAAIPAEKPAVSATVRIKAGSDKNWRDKKGNEWLADTGFTEGAMVDLGKIEIANTENPELYTSEHSNMEKFAYSLPNGKYTLRLYFVEPPDDVKKAGERVFSIESMGEKIKDLDIFKEAGGANKALVKSMKVNVTGGKLEINFKAGQKEPVINAIEIIRD